LFKAFGRVWLTGRIVWGVLLCAGLVGLGACGTGASTAQHSTPAATASLEPTERPAEPAPTGAVQATAAPTAAESDGRLEITSYRSPLLGTELPLLVYLPPGFDQEQEPLPVVYLLHGRGYDEWQWVDLGATRLATQAIRGGLWPPFALVMPYQPEPLFSSSDGGPRSYEAEFLEGLMPAVERRFQLTDRGSRRGIAGISRGAVWALEIAFRHPQQISGVAALSPALNVNFPRPRYDPIWIAQQGGPLPSAIFMAVGDREQTIRASAEQLSQALQQQGVEHVFTVKPGTHAQDLWTALVEPALEFLVQPWSGT
jgi:enterochelin esterase-like enzyme